MQSRISRWWDKVHGAPDRAPHGCDVLCESNCCPASSWRHPFFGANFELEKSTTQHRMALPCYTIMRFEPQNQKNKPKWIGCPCSHKFLSAKRCAHWRVLGWSHLFSACCILNPDSSHQFPAKKHVQKLGKKCGVEWQKKCGFIQCIQLGLQNQGPFLVPRSHSHPPCP